MSVSDKVRTDLDLHKWSNLKMVVHVIERSYPEVAVDQIWKQHVQQLKTMHTFENLNIVLTRTRTPTDVGANDWMTT